MAVFDREALLSQRHGCRARHLRWLPRLEHGLRAGVRAGRAIQRISLLVVLVVVCWLLMLIDVVVVLDCVLL